MSIERIGRAEKEQKAEQARDEERRRNVQATENRAAEHLTTVRVQESKPSGEDKTTQAVSEASRHNANRGAEWQDYSKRVQNTVPVSVTELANQANASAAAKNDQSRNTERVGETETSREARHEAQREAVKRQAEQQMTIAEIQADLMKKSGIIKG